jgi:DNA-binding transcriptional MerR regulator
LSDGRLSLAYQADEVRIELDKSPDAFRTISEVAEDLDIPQHVLRFWETRFAQIKPLKRGGGRRYYRPDDVDLLRGIRRCLYDAGYTIKGLQRILKEQGQRHVQAIGRGDAVVGEMQSAAASARPVDPVFSPEALPTLRSVPSQVASMPSRNVTSAEAGHASALPGMAPRPMSGAPTGLATTASALAGSQGLAALKATLFELDACRRMLDAALVNGDDGLSESA